MKEEWLFPEAVVPVDAETTAALVAEIHRLIDVVGGMALKEPALQDIEQYRLQMAGICTAAIGYWKESDSIHPDYDTLALRDVAKLYAKYDELYKAQDVSHGMIAGALFDFMAWLTSRPKRIMLSSADDASPAVDAIEDFAKMRGLSLDDAQVQNWQEALAQPEQKHPLQVKADRDKAWSMRETNCGCDHNEYCEKCWPLAFRKGGYWDQQEALAQTEERNFCPRCGKRTADLTTIHTCTPPQENT